MLPLLVSLTMNSSPLVLTKVVALKRHVLGLKQMSREGVSINQLITSAVAEKMSALLTEEYLQARAKQGSRRRFDAVLAKVPDVEPDASDVRPPSRGGRRKSKP